jgi:hypothetical protein
MVCGMVWRRYFSLAFSVEATEEAQPGGPGDPARLASAPPGTLPGLVTATLAAALGMRSQLEPPPWLQAMAARGLPPTYLRAGALSAMSGAKPGGGAGGRGALLSPVPMRIYGADGEQQVTLGGQPGVAAGDSESGGAAGGEERRAGAAEAPPAQAEAEAEAAVPAEALAALGPHFPCAFEFPGLNAPVPHGASARRWAGALAAAAQVRSAVARSPVALAAARGGLALLRQQAQPGGGGLDAEELARQTWPGSPERQGAPEDAPGGAEAAADDGAGAQKANSSAGQPVGSTLPALLDSLASGGVLGWPGHEGAAGAAPERATVPAAAPHVREHGAVAATSPAGAAHSPPPPQQPAHIWGPQPTPPGFVSQQHSRWGAAPSPPAPLHATPGPAQAQRFVSPHSSSATPAAWPAWGSAPGSSGYALQGYAAMGGAEVGAHSPANGHMECAGGVGFSRGGGGPNPNPQPDPFAGAQQFMQFMAAAQPP